MSCKTKSRYGSAQEREPVIPEILTTEQFCSLTQIHPITAVVWRRQGKGPPFIDARGPRFVRYLRKDVLAWMQRNRRNAVATKCSTPAQSVGGRDAAA
jgi:predicted site-specific integrase-resolvase